MSENVHGSKNVQKIPVMKIYQNSEIWNSGASRNQRIQFKNVNSEKNSDILFFLVHFVIFLYFRHVIFWHFCTAIENNILTFYPFLDY